MYEVTALSGNEKTDNVGDASELERMLELAEAADRTSQEYETAPQELKGAFEESILDGKEVRTATTGCHGFQNGISSEQSIIDLDLEKRIKRYWKNSSLRVKKH
ncbi:MAG: hypothetical protein ACLVC1_04800 [Mediterraneibacter gnavus]